MTPQEIIKEFQKLPPTQRREVLNYISDLPEADSVSEEEIARHFLASGVISEIPENWDKPDEEFEPIEVIGKPLSETIIEDRN